ncbi:MAG: hypothetical protein IT585_08685 [candidate division Zixibacteria bacterium]|nr:hypothetical protein [candidate division Zixibacteria bacterium]
MRVQAFAVATAVIGFCFCAAVLSESTERKRIKVSREIEDIEYEIMSLVIANKLVNVDGPHSEIEAFTGINEVEHDTLKVVIDPLTSGDLSLRDLHRDELYYTIQKQWQLLKLETFDDFVVKNFGGEWLSRRFVFDFGYRLMAGGEDDQYEADEDGFWEAFYRVYPRYIGITTVSRVGFDEERTQALIYVAQQQEGLSGSGWLYCLECVDGKWVIQAQYMRYIS